MLDPLEPVLGRLLADWPDIKAPRVTEMLRDDYGYAGSVDLVRKRLAQLRPRSERPAQKTGYRPGQVLQVDWAEMPIRPRIAGRERRGFTLVGASSVRERGSAGRGMSPGIGGRSGGAAPSCCVRFGHLVAALTWKGHQENPVRGVSVPSHMG